jgi:hypothetical protein
MITYTWSIIGLLVENIPEPETVVISNFIINGVDEDGVTGQVNYSVNLLPPDAQNFTPYAEVTEAQVIEWTQSALGPDRVISMEQEIADQIAQSYIPTPQPAPLPWNVPA